MQPGALHRRGCGVVAELELQLSRRCSCVLKRLVTASCRCARCPVRSASLSTRGKPCVAGADSFRGPRILQPAARDPHLLPTPCSNGGHIRSWASRACCAVTLGQLKERVMQLGFVSLLAFMASSSPRHPQDVLTSTGGRAPQLESAAASHRRTPRDSGRGRCALRGIAIAVGVHAPRKASALSRSSLERRGGAAVRSRRTMVELRAPWRWNAVALPCCLMIASPALAAAQPSPAPEKPAPAEKRSTSTASEQELTVIRASARRWRR